MPDTEQHLIQRAQKGDHEAFAALVTGHQLYVYNLALRVLKDEQEALDLAQETFVPVPGPRSPIFVDNRSSAPGCIALSPIFVTTVCLTCAVPSTIWAMTS